MATLKIRLLKVYQILLRQKSKTCFKTTFLRIIDETLTDGKVDVDLTDGGG